MPDGPAPRCHWSTQDDRILVETLLVQKAAGNQAQSGWKSTAWVAVAGALREVAAEGEVEKTAKKCSDHYANVCTGYVVIKFPPH
jgi:hypothetical protein